jgi:molybdate transport system permease protein
VNSPDTIWLPEEAWRAVWLTLRLAALVTVVLLVVSIPLAAGIASVRSRWIAVLEAVVGLPLVLPPTVIGFYLLALAAPDTPAGRFWFRLTGDTLAFSFSGLVVGSVCYSLPYAVQPIVAAMRAVPAELLEAAHALGAGRVSVIARVLLPLSRRGVVVAAMLAFAHTLGEFGVVVMLGGNIPGRTRVASIALYDQVQRLDYAAAHRLAALMLALALVILVPLAWLQRAARPAR